MNYAIIDVETTGMGVQGNKITEIAVLVHDGEKVIDEFQTLVNPQCSIPFSISRLTGIYDHMVKDAPKFYEIAKNLVSITEDCVFVAHNVNFDYNVIRKEFSDLGFNYVRKKLCTIRLSRKLVPGLPSYSLGKICGRMGIRINDRHRAMGDARATAILFDKLIQLDQHGAVFESFLKPRSRQATLPPQISVKMFEALPESPGVYYFRDNKDKIIYVGKAINIKQRVLSHFYDRSNKEIKMCNQTARITYELTGSELVALLMESAEIKRHYPIFNRAQRRTNEGLGIFTYVDRSGIMHLAWNRLNSVADPLIKLFNATECRIFMERLCEKYDLCPKYCHLQSNTGGCFHYQLKQCKGVCRGRESIESYNARVMAAIDEIKGDSSSYVIRQQGRTNDEITYVLIEKGIYQGYGYLMEKEDDQSVSTYRRLLIRQRDNRDVQRILNSFRNKNEDQFEALEITEADIYPQEPGQNYSLF